MPSASAAPEPLSATGASMDGYQPRALYCDNMYGMRLSMKVKQLEQAESHVWRVCPPVAQRADSHTITSSISAMRLWKRARAFSAVSAPPCARQCL